MQQYRITAILPFDEKHGQVEAANYESAAKKFAKSIFGTDKFKLRPYDGNETYDGAIAVTTLDYKDHKMFTVELQQKQVTTNGQSLSDALKNMKNDKVNITLYGTSSQVTRKQGVKQMVDCMLASEGSEYTRYSQVLLQLLLGYKNINA